MALLSMASTGNWIVCGRIRATNSCLPPALYSAPSGPIPQWKVRSFADVWSQLAELRGDFATEYKAIPCRAAACETDCRLHELRSHSRSWHLPYAVLRIASAHYCG